MVEGFRGSGFSEEFDFFVELLDKSHFTLNEFLAAMPLIDGVAIVRTCLNISALVKTHNKVKKQNSTYFFMCRSTFS